MPGKRIESTIRADGVDIAVVTTVGSEEDYISLTDIVRHRNPEFPADVVKNWLRLRSTIEFLGLWERLNNRDFKLIEFDQFRIVADAWSLVSTSGAYASRAWAEDAD